MGRIGAVLARHALSTTANYLEDNSFQVIDDWDRAAARIDRLATPRC